MGGVLYAFYLFSSEVETPPISKTGEPHKLHGSALL